MKTIRRPYLPYTVKEYVEMLEKIAGVEVKAVRKSNQTIHYSKLP